MTDKAKALRALIEKVEAGERRDGLNTWSCFPEPLDMLAVDAFDGSLDAAKDLHEAVLPGWRCILCMTYPLASASVFEVNQDQSHTVGKHRTIDAHDERPARAWLTAILRALEAQEADA